MSVVAWISVAIFVLGISRYATPWLWRYKLPIAGWLLTIGGAGAVALVALGLVLNMMLGGTHGGWNVLEEPEKVLPDQLFFGGAGFVGLGLGVLLISGGPDQTNRNTPDYPRRTIGRLDSWS